MMFLSHRRAKRFMSALGVFECLTILIIISYVYYIGTLVSDRGDDVKITTEEIPPLFSISKRVYTNSASTSKLPTPTVEKKCSVAIVIILCEDEIYLTITKRNATKSNSSIIAHQQKSGDTAPIAKDFSRQINQTLVLLKSIAILTKYETKSSSCVEVLLLSDKPQHYKKIKHEIETQWSQEFQQLVRLTNFPVRYPPGSAWMKKLFRPCATLRLFLAELIPANVWDSIIYLDTDIIFLQSVQALWGQFERFNDDKSSTEDRHHGSETSGDDSSEKIAAMAPCLFHYGSNSNVVPYFGSSGLNAGIMLMNLTRMRGSQWTNKIRMVTTMFQDKIKLADQDILNIYFHFFPEELHVLTCDWNFRPFQCREGSTCEDPEIGQGISALHGNALSFTAQGTEPLFRVVFQQFHKTKLDSQFKLARFVDQLESSLLKAEENTHRLHSQCKQFGGFDVLLLNRLYSLAEE